MTPQADSGSVEGLRPNFGDLVENGWASEGNPMRRGFFVRAFKRTGRLNPGLTWEITDGAGKFWEFKPRDIGERLTVTPRSEPTPPPPVEGGWRPIESAPKDGTGVIVLERWDETAWFVGEARYLDDDRGWWRPNNDPTDHYGEELRPTHWMPLPSPPEATR